MSISLCPDDPKCYDCPSVEIKDDLVYIGEDENTCCLKMAEFNVLKEKIKNNEI